ncbi:MAG: CAP domain-containing protein [Alphaproteobacteria bacterium]|nr:CAP domain-containing protein [Alphaproteobacteria bacterium]MBV9062924.1 CAP domain-containing protein [Alphaproteobacteria bacterium]
MHMAAKPSAEPKMLMPALENRIYELVDQERHKLDPAARPLALDSELVKAARQKSADMAAHHYLAHYAPDGQTAAGIIMEDDENFHGILGENLAAQPYLPKFGVDVETFARSLVNTWLASKGHRDNLADTAFGRTGIGAAANADTVYVTELFADDPASQKSQSSLQRNVSP